MGNGIYFREIKKNLNTGIKLNRDPVARQLNIFLGPWRFSDGTVAQQAAEFLNITGAQSKLFGSKNLWWATEIVILGSPTSNCNTNDIFLIQKRKHES